MYNNNSPANTHISASKTPLIVFLGLLLVSFFSGCTDNEKQIPPPEIFLATENDGEELETILNDTITLEPRITYNIDPVYQWRKNNILLDHSEQFLQDTATQLGRVEYFFSVTTPYGSDSITIPVDIIVLAGFQDLELQAETDTFWVGTPDTVGFTHKEIFFPNHFTNDSVWMGFGYGNIHTTSFTLPETPYSAFGQAANQNKFGLVRQPDDSSAFLPAIEFLDGKNHKLKSLEITNTSLGHYIMNSGHDDFEIMGGPDNTKPDWCKVTITGIDKNGETTGELDFYLADYRFENNRKNYIVDKWNEIDLKGLGSVNKLQFSISSSKTDEQGEMITPEMFCIDNLKILN